MNNLVDALLEQLADDKDPCAVDLNKCGKDIIGDFTAAGQLIRNNIDYDGARVRMEHFIQLSYKNMASLPPSRSKCWRRLYTDACIFKALAQVIHPDQVSIAIALEAIGTLDRAIITAGAAGEGRLPLILDFIREIQSAYLSAYPMGLPLFDLSIDDRFQSPKCATYCDTPPCISPPSFTAFQNQWAHTPFILRKYLSDWPAMTDHPWSSIEYLHSVAGPGRVVPVEVGEDYRSEEWSQRLIDWNTFLSSLYTHHQDQGKREVLYLAQHNLLTQFPALRDDIIVPDYVYSSLSPPANCPGYAPPGNEDRLIINVWLGPKGTISPAHTDPFFNCYAQVVGRKTVWLAPPDVQDQMYPYSERTSGIADKAHNPAANTTNPMMSNTSRVDVFPSSEEAETQSKSQFPAFWENVPKKASCAILEPGDMLFFPPGWWHAMRSEEPSFSVSMWF
ncbi:hypothetical protein BJ138DRAFT_1157340 [Hygrophoropsis aurantiaca]|uniref:Uncharacterized protein n=1 Tax=Hygrophoropsis aurantiaca TaxID=72124 RepID=A0ACB8A548_9AGAM|nr:hypothetical protein BJ138DRAFT_1157340 [Hygrophoropsis aurantiaca]